MDRRTFLKQVSMWSAGFLVSPPVFDITANLFASEGNPQLFIAEGENYRGMAANVVNHLGGMKRFVKKGDKVVIKPNIGWDRNIDQGANTHPDIVAELARLCLEADASSVSVFDRTCNEERRCYINSGIRSALKKIRDRRLKLEFIDDRKFVPVAIKNGQALKEWQFYKEALTADCYINVPVAKHHGLSGLSIGMKNIMGVIGGRRGKIHSNIDVKLADLNTVIRPHLTIVDATRIIVKNGPRGGGEDDVKKMDTVIGCVDPVAADAYATTLFGMEPDQLGSTVEAYKRGLGQMDLDKCDIRLLTGETG